MRHAPALQLSAARACRTTPTRGNVDEHSGRKELGSAGLQGMNHQLQDVCMHLCQCEAACRIKQSKSGTTSAECHMCPHLQERPID